MNKITTMTIRMMEIITMPMLIYGEVDHDHYDDKSDDDNDDKLNVDFMWLFIIDKS